LTPFACGRYSPPMRGDPVRVGILHDFPRADGGASFEWAVRLGVDEVDGAGRLPCEASFVHEPAHGGAHALRSGFTRLVEQGVVAILGPAITDGALLARPLADDAGVACINYSGSDEARGAWMFHFQIGSLEEEPAVLVADLMRRRLARVALVRDTSHVGERLADFFGLAAAAAGCEIVAHAVVDEDGTGAASAVTAARRTSPDALAFVGFWRGAHAVAIGRQAIGWDVPAVANSALMYGHAAADWTRAWEGWTYVDTFSEANPRFAALTATAVAAGRSAGPGEAGAYDMGRLIAEGLVRAPELTRAGVRTGLERVKALPAATGRAGTLMGFGNWDRGALKGEYLVLREWRGGRSVEHTAAS
jgi:branched-chain amino acid transport system substrate-binding protein